MFFSLTCGADVVIIQPAEVISGWAQTSPLSESQTKNHKASIRDLKKEKKRKFFPQPKCIHNVRTKSWFFYLPVRHNSVQWVSIHRIRAQGNTRVIVNGGFSVRKWPKCPKFLSSVPLLQEPTHIRAFLGRLLRYRGEHSRQTYQYGSVFYLKIHTNREKYQVIQE